MQENSVSREDAKTQRGRDARRRLSRDTTIASAANLAGQSGFAASFTPLRLRVFA
jgi:hypothetical protein